MPNLMVALPNIGGALCSTPQSLADAYYYTVSQKTSHLWLAITLTQWILIFFGRNVTDNVGNQKTFYYVTSNNLCSTLPGKTRKHENHIFHSIGLCYTHNARVRYLPERKKLS